MPLTAKGAKILAAMQEQYGEEEGKRVFYASKNSGKITGVDAMPPARLHLTDTFVLDGVHKSSDGYLAADARVARTGIQIYKGHEVGKPDQDKVRLYRPPEEVFHQDAMHSAAHRPVTLTHPSVMVNSKNWSKYAKGHTGDEVVRDGEYMRVPMTLMDQAAIDAYNDGCAELSAGYTTDVDWTAGTSPEGEDYDGIQKKIRMNHFAFVPTARGGSALRFGDGGPGSGRKPGGNSIVHETANHYVSQIGPGNYEVYRNGPTAVTRVASIHFSNKPDYALSRAKAEAERREGAMKDSVLIPQEGEQLRCPKCNGQLHKADEPCPQCGYVGDAGMGKKCMDCGAMMGRDAMVCDECGGKLRSMKDAMYWDRDFDTEERKQLAKEGKAKPDGSYPIVTRGDLKNAIHAWGRGGATESDKNHIKKRAKALGAEEDLPEDWGGAKDGATVHDNRKVKKMPVTLTFDGVSVEIADDTSAGNMQAVWSALNKRLRDAETRVKKFDEDEVEKEKAREEKERGKKEEQDKKDAKNKDTMDALIGENLALKKQLEDAQKNTSPQVIDKLLAAREAIKDAAKTVLPSNFTFDGKSDVDIQRAAVAAKLGDGVVREMNDAAVHGAFLAVTKDTSTASGSGIKRMVDAFAAHGQTQDTIDPSRGVALRDAAYAEYMERLQGKKPWATRAQ